MIAAYHQQIQSNPPQLPPFLAEAASAPPASAISAKLYRGPQPEVVSQSVGCLIHSPSSLRQTQSVLPTSVTPSNTQTTLPPSVAPRQGLILATNLDHATPSLNKPSAAPGATISPSITSTVSPAMDPLTLKTNTVNEHAKASAAAAAAAAAPAPAPAPANRSGSGSGSGSVWKW
jgi:hypothetical protein